MGRIKVRDALITVAIAIVSAFISTAPLLEGVHGLSLDALTALRPALFGPKREAAASPTVVIAIDEETYQTPPFKGSPTLTWTREIGRVLSAVLEGGAKVIGFDVIFPSSIEESRIPFGEEFVGNRMRGFDRDYLRALRAGADTGKLVLGEIQQRDFPTVPYAGQRLAVRQQNIRALNVYVDSDEVIRRLPLSFVIDGQRVPSMAVELAARAGYFKPVFAADGALLANGRRISGAVPGTLTLNFEGGADDIPTYSLADLRACLEKGDRDYFKRQFEGKIVLFGTLLHLEDRKLTSKRFATGIEGARAPRCALAPAPVEGVEVNRATIAGVYVHATAINNFAYGDTLRELAWWQTTLIAIVFALAAAVAARRLPPIGAALAFVGLAVLFTFVAVALFARAVALPLTEPFIAGFIATIAMIGYRYMVADREERFLKASFGLYLAPQVIEQMIDSNKLPDLGGEMRDVTVFFSDLAGFSSTAEQLSPDALVQLMNEYLSAMTDIIEDCGGYVDKYIGDSIVAVFGAPVSDSDHARNAVRATLRCRDRLEEMNRTATAFQGHKLSHRIGLNSGEALVGNIGSRRRFNYTVMSDAVNLASRLEGANKYFATSILASEMTVALTKEQFLWREVDAVLVQGRAHPVRIYEPLAEKGQESEGRTRIASIYADGLARWRTRDFQGAVNAFEKIAAEDAPAKLFLARARELALHSPAEDWEAVTMLEGK